MKTTHKKHNGFTIIELMVALVIIGVLTQYAIAKYTDYSIRAQVSEGITLAEGAKSLVTEYHASHGDFPVTSDDAAYSGSAGKYVSGTVISNGVITATLGNDVNSKVKGKIVDLKPILDDNTNNITWQCESNLEQKYLPSSCTQITDSAPSQPQTPQPFNKFESLKFFTTSGSPFNSTVTNTIVFNTDGTMSITVVTSLPASTKVTNYQKSVYTAPDGTLVMNKSPFSAVMPDGSMYYQASSQSAITLIKLNGDTGTVTTATASNYPQWMTDYLSK